MAMIHCPECGKEISSNAKSCPNCGCEIIVCPDCGAVYKEKSETCSNCGHVFASSPIQSEKQERHDDFKGVIASKMTIVKVMKYFRIVLIVANILCIIIPIIMIRNLPTNDPIKYLDSVATAERTFRIAIVISAFFEFGSQIIDILFMGDCNILHKLSANDMTMYDVNGSQYCKENENLLSGEGKKLTAYKFAVNAAYRQDNKAGDKYNIMLITFGIIFAAIDSICLTVSIYQLFDRAIYCAIWNLKFNFWKSINYAAAIIGIITLIGRSFVESFIELKYANGLRTWCKEKSLSDNFNQ